MPGKIFLSPLKSIPSLPVPNPGRWNPVGDFLTKYSSDILVEGELSDRMLVHSVPTVFARPIQFSQALENEAHPAHASVVGQWRGLLAVFALQRWLETSVEVREFSLKQKAGAEVSPAERPLHSVLRNQLPKPEEEWERWWLLYCQGELLGATSPWTLVYTAADYTCPAGIPWQEEGGLIDPVRYFDPTGRGKSRELALLHAWILKAIEGERDRWGMAEKVHLEKFMKTLTRELGKWKKELERYRDEATDRLKLADSAARVREAPYRHFLVNIATEGVRAPSDLLLDSATGEDVLVFTRQGLNPRLRVHGPVLAEQIDVEKLPGPTGRAEWRTPAGRTIPWPYVIAEEAFLPPKLAQVELSEEAYSVGGIDSNKFAVPLTPYFFHYFDLETLIQKGLLVEVAPDDRKVKVQLRLPLKGGEFLSVTKEYDRKSDVFYVQGETPGLAFWPDFYEPDWRHNFGLYGAPPESNLAVAPLSAGGGTLEPSASDGTELDLRAWFSREPLLGFALFHRDERDGSTTDAGLVLRRTLRRAVTTSQKHWTVAVDFGTSSTHLMRKEEGSSEVVPFSLSARTVLLTQAAQGNEPAVARGIYPNRSVAPPFPTLLHRNDGTLIQGEDVSAPQRDFYTPRFSIYPLLLDRIVRDLKWSARGGAYDERPLREYLTALVRTIACEARAAGVNDLKIEWSYPLSLPASTRYSMEGFWKAVSRSFSIPDVLKVQAGEGISESEALCRHMASGSSPLPILADSLSVAIDIGGGSSDLSFWASQRLLDQVSLKLAGNDVLIPLVNVAGFLASLVEVCDPNTPPEQNVEKVRAQPQALLNVLLTQAMYRDGRQFSGGDPREHPVAQALEKDLAGSEAPWSIARSAVHLFVAGLTFYAGLHARRWWSQLSGKNQVTLFFGGRGASLLTWIARDSHLRSVLQSAFLRGLTLDLEESPEIDLRLYAPGLWYDGESLLKSEVVRGLLPPALSGAKPQRFETTVVGELGWRTPDGKVLEWDAEVGAEQLRLLIPPPNHDSGYMAFFLNRVIPEYLDLLGLDAMGLKSLRLDPARVQDHLRRGASKESEVLQPVFAVELKVLLERYLEQAVHGHAA
jgi:hypothetical protein